MTTVSLPESLIGTPPGSDYTDPAGFAREQERIFERTWFAVARATDLPTPGKFVTRQVGRESVLVVRGRDGALRAFLNVCRHRGAQLCRQPEGELRRSIQCMYHAWTYGFDGKLIAAPNLASFEGVRKEDYGLREVHLREWIGYAWVNLADAPPSFEQDVLGSATTRLGEENAIGDWKIDSLTVGHRIEYDVRANWKLLIENFMECYHCATIHPELTEVLPEFTEGWAAQSYVGHGASFGDDVQGFTVDGSEGLGTIPGLAPERDRKYYAITVRPNVFINMMPDHVVVHRMYPLAADRTLVECDWLFAPETLAEAPDLTRTIELFDRVNRQDFDACEATQPGMASRSYRDGGVLVPNEHHLADFHEWVTERLNRPL
ncbi:aromatic ring-hydroxylating dioxygenase subunit alpha [Spongisporangium articulatum]|uniref:Aromatic ring-hydroxylating dioxygenase subunit alpha n=1 Tax=Spongisporangium articulatum TaxID=3362603 RepID=A0ABW8AK79_9ACTN